MILTYNRYSKLVESSSVGYTLKKFSGWEELQSYINESGDWENWTLYYDEYRDIMTDGMLNIDDPYHGDEDIYGLFGVDGKLYGIVTLSLYKGELWVGDFQIGKEYRGMGVGKVMWEMIKRDIDFNVATCTYLDEKAKSFWLKMGWNHSHAKVMEYVNR